MLHFTLTLFYLLFIVLKLQVEVYKNPNLGFSIGGGIGSSSNPFHPNDNKVCKKSEGWEQSDTISKTNEETKPVKLSWY